VDLAFVAGKYTRPLREAPNWAESLLEFYRADGPGGLSPQPGEPLVEAAAAAASRPRRRRFGAENTVARRRVDLVISGDSDATVPAAAARSVADGLGCSLVELEKCGHLPHEEWPQETADLIVELCRMAAV